MNVYYHSSWSTEADQTLLHEKLPVSHEYGDRRSTLKDGTTLIGKAQHDAYASPELRIRCRKRCSVFRVKAGERQVYLCFSSIPDWQALGLDVESFFLTPFNNHLPRIGPYGFNIGSYISSIYEDLAMSLCALKKSRASEKDKFHLKLVPLGIGPTVRTRFGDYISPVILPAYLLALQYACIYNINESWVDSLEFVDHTRGSLSPFVNLTNVRIISNTSRDAYDFNGCTGIPAIVAPCDSFCVIGSTAEDKTLATTLANYSDLREKVSGPITFTSWP
jgi:hypothetical protein